MSDISKIQIGSALYDINDATARNDIEAVTLNAVNRNGIYRGKDLGTITASNIETFFTNHKVSTGEFTDLYVGDTFVIQDGTYNKRYVIAGFDTEYNTGANLSGNETLREILDAAAEATQTIYYVDHESKLVFKRLDVSGDAVYTINKNAYFSLHFVI